MSMVQFGLASLQRGPRTQLRGCFAASFKGCTDDRAIRLDGAAYARVLRHDARASLSFSNCRTSQKWMFFQSFANSHGLNRLADLNVETVGRRLRIENVGSLCDFRPFLEGLRPWVPSTTSSASEE